jgi:hypothetical protein
MATWLRVVSNTADKYCVELDVEGEFQRVSTWYDTLADAQSVANGFVAQKAAGISEAASYAENDPLERTVEVAIAE